MSLLTPKEIEKLEPLLAKLEREEPILCSWRHFGRKNESSVKKCACKALSKIKRSVFKTKNENVQFPKGNQIVIINIRNTPSTFGSLFPIIKELHQRGMPPFLIISNSTQFSLNFNYHSGYCTIEQFLYMIKNDPKKQKEIFQKAKHYEKKMEEVTGLNIFKNAREWIIPGLTAYFSAKEILPNCGFVLADSDIGSFEKGIFKFCNQENIPSAILQHGFYDTGLFPIHAKYNLDWGPYFSKEALKYRHPLERSISLGCPRFDRIEEIKKEAKDPNYFKKYGIDKRPIVVVLSGVHIYGEFPQSIEFFFESIKSLLENNIEVVIKRHPAEVDKTIYEKFLEKKMLQKVHFALPDEDFHRLLYNSDFVYTNASTGSMEAMLLEVPVLWQEGAEENPLPDIPLLGGGVYIDSKTIATIVKEIGTDGSEREEVIKKQENFLSQAIVNRGKATSTTVDFILTCIKERE